MEFFYNLFGVGPKIIFSDGKVPPWSHTVVNANRTRTRSKRRWVNMVILFAVIAGLMCITAWGAVAIFGGGQKKTSAAAQAMTATRQPTAKPTTNPPTITPKPTVAQATPTRMPMIKATVVLDPMAGPPGAEVVISVVASDNADVLVWLDNAFVLGKSETSDRQVVFTFKIPHDTTPGRHLVMVDVTNYDSNDRKIIPFEVTQ